MTDQQRHGAVTETVSEIADNGKPTDPDEAFWATVVMFHADKQRRSGRPVKLHPELLRQMYGVDGARHQSTRSLANAHYHLHGVKALGDIARHPANLSTKEVRYRDFFCGPAGTPDGNKAWRMTALVEIGRIAVSFGPSTAREAADAMIEKYRRSNTRPRTRDIVADLRAWRLEGVGGKRQSGDYALYRKLNRLVNEHRRMYPQMQISEIVSVLQATQDALLE